MIKTTIIELTADVNNPHPDRRSKDWDKQPVLAHGTRFIYREDKDYGMAVMPATRRYGWQPVRDGLGALIVANSKPVPPATWQEFAVLAGCDWGADEILRILVKLGRLGEADFRAVGQTAEDF